MLLNPRTDHLNSLRAVHVNPDGYTNSGLPEGFSVPTHLDWLIVGVATSLYFRIDTRRTERGPLSFPRSVDSPGLVHPSLPLPSVLGPRRTDILLPGTSHSRQSHTTLLIPGHPHGTPGDWVGFCDTFLPGEEAPLGTDTLARVQVRRPVMPTSRPPGSQTWVYRRWVRPGISRHPGSSCPPRLPIETFFTELIRLSGLFI